MKKTLQIILLIAVGVFCLNLLVIPTYGDTGAVSGWGDNGGGRKSYTQEEVANNALRETIVFNSISDSKIGDEKNFVGARLHDGANQGADNIWNGNEVFVQNGDVYLVRLYVHNNSMLGYEGISQNTKVAFNIPIESATSIPVHGYIFSDNATPSEYWDEVLFKSEQKFHLEYVYGSALLENDGIGADGIPLSDEIVTKAASNNGTLIGYDALDGRIPGGEQYASYVTIKIMVVFEGDFTVNQSVRLAGDTEWKTNVDAKAGDLVEFQTEYKNISEDQTHKNVMIKTILPDNLAYVPGSTILYNGNHPDGATVNDTDTMDIVKTGVNVGNYAAGANAYIRFTAKVVDNSLQPGSNTLVNWVQGGVGQVTLQDYATVIVNKTK